MSDDAPAASLLQSAIVAFQNWAVVFGIVASSITAFNLVQKVADIGLSRVFSDVLANYQNWIHEPILWLLDRIGLSRPPAGVIDFVLLWLLVGGIVLRSAWVSRSSVQRLRTEGNVSDRRFWNYLLKSKGALAPFLVVCLVFWPIIVGYLVSEPYGLRSAWGDITFWSAPHSGFQPYCDMRAVLLLQAAAALACVAVWLVTNVVMTTYE